MIIFQEDVIFFSYQDKKLKVLLDYGHNPDGIETVLKIVENFPVKRVISVVGVPGDRSDELVKETGKIVGKHNNLIDKVIIKEDEYLSDREPGEVAKLLGNTIETEFAGELTVEHKLEEVDAIKYALEEANENDLVVIFYEQRNSFF